MGIVSSIYDAPIISKTVEDNKHITVVILYNGEPFVGESWLHDEDSEFYSYKVGSNIALSRARINAMKYALKRTRYELIIKKDMYNQITGYGIKDDKEIDPTGAITKNIHKTENRVYTLNRALKKEKYTLRTYIKGQNRVIQCVRRFRNKDNNN